MKKIYEAPELFVDEYVADTMIASSGEEFLPKNGNPNNQNCYGCDTVPKADGREDYCIIDPVLNPGYYDYAC